MKKIAKGINKVKWKYQIGETISIDEWKIKIISKGIIPSKEELEENNRARSSRLRIIEKIKD